MPVDCVSQERLVSKAHSNSPVRKGCDKDHENRAIRMSGIRMKNGIALPEKQKISLEIPDTAKRKFTRCGFTPKYGAHQAATQLAAASAVRFQDNKWQER